MNCFRVKFIAFTVIISAVCVWTKAAGGFTTTSPQPLWNSTETDRLRHDLLLNYDKFARPAQHFNVTRVRFGVTLRHIELNEFKSTMTVHAWIRLRWMDEKLKWNTSEYGGITQLNLAEHEIWQPDLFLYNSGTSINHFGSTHCIVLDNGEVLWVPPAQFTTLCELNFRYWPFDVQDCYLKFGSWTYNGNQVDLFIMDNITDVKREMIIESTEWDLTKTSMEKNMQYYPCCDEPYPDITVNLTLTRISPSYKTLIATPMFAIVLLILVAFWLPPQSGEKISLNACTAIIIVLFLLYFTQKLPAMGNHTPLIVLFYSSSLYVVAFSTIGSVIVIWMARTKHTSPVPWIIKHTLTGIFGRILGLSIYIQQTSLPSHGVTAEEMRDHQVTDFDESISGDEHHIIRSTNSKALIQKDWILLAAAIDRISFCFYSFLFVILAITY